jgi:hypothetical protein
MTDSQPFTYRVKYKDIRVKPPADETSKARAKATRVCEAKGCDLAGDCPAPKHGSNGRHWFCERHAGEYNRDFNFFDGMTEAEAAAFADADRHGQRRTWRFGTGPMNRAAAASGDPRRWQGRGFFDLGETTPEPRDAGRSQMVVKALGELDLEANAEPAAIRARYADYVRRFHPDSNHGDRSSEDKLGRVLRAGKILKSAGLMKAG